MFLLNPGARYNAPQQKKFTIQNVSIKLYSEIEDLADYINLQYKMFLLNGHGSNVQKTNAPIYNTKCFY